jgi:phage protein D
VAQQNIASAVGIKVTCGKEVQATHLVSFAVEMDLGQPDMCTVTIRNEDNSYSKLQVGQQVTIEVGDNNTKIFSGDIVGLEPAYKANGENTVTVRAFNKLHKLLRGRKSKTFVDRSDSDIVGEIARPHQLVPKCGDAANIVHKHVYQHNQTDLEFLRVRAARLGFDVWVEGDNLHFDQPNSGEDSGVKMRYGDAEASKDKGAVFLKYFTPRKSSTGVVNSVEVRGWNPEKKEEIIGTAQAEASRLGSTGAASAIGSFGGTGTFEVDQPIFSKEEADLIAKAKLREAMMSFMTGEGECRGSPEVKPGIVVTITVNPDQKDDPFNGKYLVTGVSHRYSNPTRGDAGGYVTSFRVCRDAEGPAGEVG